MTSKLSVLGRFMISVLLAACLMPSGIEAQDKSPIRIGAVLSATGVAATLGDPQIKTLELYVKQINASGGIDGRPVELFAYDDSSSARKAHQLGTRLIEYDKVHVIIGPSTTGSSRSVGKLAEAAKIPVLSLAGGSALVNPIAPYMFVMGATDLVNVERIYQYMRERGIKNIGIIAGTDGYGTSATRVAHEIAGNYGIEIVGSERFNPKDTDMTSQLTKLKGKPNIQAVLNLGFGQPGAIVMRNYAQLGITLPHFATQALGSEAAIAAAGEAAEGIIIVVNPGFFGLLPASHPRKRIVDDYLANYLEEYSGSKIPSATAGYSLDALMLVKDIVERTHSIDPVKLRDELERVDEFRGAAGVYRFSSRDHVGLDTKSLALGLVKGGGEWALADKAVE